MSQVKEIQVHCYVLVFFTLYKLNTVVVTTSLLLNDKEKMSFLLWTNFEKIHFYIN